MHRTTRSSDVNLGHDVVINVKWIRLVMHCEHLAHTEYERLRLHATTNKQFLRSAVQIILPICE